MPNSSPRPPAANPPTVPPGPTPSGPGPGGTVRAGVLAALGRPPGLYEVVVRPVWDGHYRVNVLVGPDAGSVRIAHSYLVEAGADGVIRSAKPQITREYDGPARTASPSAGDRVSP